MRKKILLVDDEETLRWALHEALTEEGYDVENTNDGVKALEFARKANYDLVISDLRMPTMGGLQLVSEIKKIRPNAKSIIITAYGSIETVIEAMHIGTSDFVTKPFKIEHIKNVIHRVLDEFSMSNNNVGDAKNNEEFKASEVDSSRETKICFLAKDTTGIANHIFYDFIRLGNLSVFLFGSVPNKVKHDNLAVMVKTIFRYIYMTETGKTPASLLRDINRYLCKNILQRFPVTFFCAVLDKQRQILCYSIYGEELTSHLIMPNKEVWVLESCPCSLNMFPGTTIRESTVSFMPGSKLVLIQSNSLLKALENGKISSDEVKDVISDVNGDSCEDIAKGIKFQIERWVEVTDKEKDFAVMVLNLTCETEEAWEEVISIVTPINNYGEILEQFDKKLSSVVVDNSKRHQIVTSINEAVLNTVSYAYNKDEKGEILLKFFKWEDEIIIEICDQGCGFDMRNYKKPDMMFYKDLTNKVGRGIFLMRHLMDRVMIQSSKEMGTIVHMAKRVTCNEN
jgi:CheY-like chemotaxis protein/anti-sigma regulatory factor (Ser/Thr protein kinase)